MFLYHTLSLYLILPNKACSSMKKRSRSHYHYLPTQSSLVISIDIQPNIKVTNFQFKLIGWFQSRVVSIKGGLVTMRFVKQFGLFKGIFRLCWGFHDYNCSHRTQIFVASHADALRDSSRLAFLPNITSIC